MYRCGECNLAVIVIGEEKIKACKCKAPIILSMETELKSFGGISDKPKKINVQ